MIRIRARNTLTLVRLCCHECGAIWRSSVSPKYWPVCPTCHSVDWDVQE